MTTPITYITGNGPYQEPDLTQAGYVDYSTDRGCSLIHAAGTLELSRSPRYPQWSMQIVQTTERTPAGWPVVFNPVLSQMPFEAVWPFMPDAELAALRAFIYSTVPVFDAFSLYLKATGATLRVRFAQAGARVRHQKKGFSEVSVSMVRV